MQEQTPVAVEFEACYLVNKHPEFMGVVVCCWYSDVKSLTHQQGLKVPGVVVQRKGGVRAALTAVEALTERRFYAVPRSQRFRGPVVFTNSLDYLGVVKDLQGKWCPNTFSKTFPKADVEGCVSLVCESLRRIRVAVEKRAVLTSECQEDAEAPMEETPDTAVIEE